VKGIVFTELLSMAEEALGEAAVDDMLDGLALSSDGVYTGVGFYPCSDLVAIVGALCPRTGLSAEALQKAFGVWMLGYFARNYREVFDSKPGPLEMLEAVHGEIHVEVRKLYPDAELPAFETTRPAPDHLRMRYSSDRPLTAFCHGLIEATVAHYGARAQVACAPQPPREAVFDIRLEP
jgi:hypothetical protein